MKTLVMKFGGASVAKAESFSEVAELILEQRRNHCRTVVVVSAMGNTTDELLALAHRVNPDPPQRELDMLLSVGERISISLLAMALARRGVEAVSFTGSQSGIITSVQHNCARIIDVRPYRLLASLAQEKVVIVAGFQGVSEDKEITTLGRGGSDTTAVALGVALGAEYVEFYKDVEGIYDLDPKKHSEAQLYRDMTYDELLRVLEMGSGVLDARCVKMARANALKLHVCTFLRKKGEVGTWIQDDSFCRPEGLVFEQKREEEVSCGSSCIF